MRLGGWHIGQVEVWKRHTENGWTVLVSYSIGGPGLGRHHWVWADELRPGLDPPVPVHHGSMVDRVPGQQPMTDEALAAVGELLQAAAQHGLGVAFEPDEPLTPRRPRGR